MSRVPLFAALSCAALACLALPRAAVAQPSTDLDSYALFAAERLTMKGIALVAGNVGVNDGPLFVHDHLIAPLSDVAADRVNVPTSATCAQQFANTSEKTSPGCAVVGGTPVPIVADVAAACGFPLQFPACDPQQAVIVPPSANMTLPPGTYGDLVVARGAVVSLGGGGYQFCSVQVSRAARLEFFAPAEVDVAGRIAVGASAFAGPAQGSGLMPGDVQVFSAGTLVRFSRDSQVQGRLCAPDASLRLTQGGSHAGTFIAARIGGERVTIDHPTPFNPNGCRDFGDLFCTGDCPPGLTCTAVNFQCACN